MLMTTMSSNTPVDEASFDTRDVLGNESDEPESSSDEDEELDAPTEEEDADEDDDAMDIDDPLPRPDQEYPPTEQRLLAVFQEMKRQNLTLASFLDLISWSDEIEDVAVIRGHRTALMRDDRLPSILQRWGKPPRSTKSNKSRPAGASKQMKEFAVGFVKEIHVAELKDLSRYMLLSTKDDVSEESFSGSTFEKVSTEMKARTPVLWDMLQELCKTRSRQRRTSKDPLRVSTCCIMSVSCVLIGSSDCCYHNLYALVCAVSS